LFSKKVKINCRLVFYLYRDGIHESKIWLSFLSIILRFLRLGVSTFFAFLQNAIYKQTWIFFIDLLFCMDFCTVYSWYGFLLGFLLGFPTFNAFLIIVSVGERCNYI
jgi:hypothetical protein